METEFKNLTNVTYRSSFDVENGYFVIVAKGDYDGNQYVCLVARFETEEEAKEFIANTQ